MATSCGADLRLNVLCHKIPSLSVAPASLVCAGIATINASPSSRSAPPVAEDGPPPAAAEQVDVRAHIRERIARGIDAINPGDGVEDDSPPVRHLVIHAGCQGDGAEWDLRATVRPRHTGVGDVIARLRHLYEHAEPDRLLGQSLANLVEQEVR